MSSLSSSSLETFIDYSKIPIPLQAIQLKEKQSSSQTSHSLVFIHPVNGTIITDKQYKSLTKTEEMSKPNKRKYQPDTSSSHVPAMKKPQAQGIKSDGRKLFSNWSIEKLNEEIAKVKSDINKIDKEAVTKEEIGKYESLSLKWKKITQETVYSLLELFPRDENYQSNTIGSVMKTFKIDPELIEYDEENDCFND